MKYILLTSFVALAAFIDVFAQELLVVKLKGGANYKYNVEDISQMTLRSSEEDLICPDNHHPHGIDLGLPSGTKWACCNIGAISPEETGGYYAWGEIEEKEEYSWSTYKHCNGSSYSCQDIGDDIAQTAYDVASIEWKGSWRMPSWRMPSIDQIKELFNYCSREWVTLNGMKGLLLVGSNGYSIFLPAAGRRYYDDLDGKWVDGYYWSSSLYIDRLTGAYGVHFNSSSYNWGYGARSDGFSVRAVCP